MFGLCSDTNLKNLIPGLCDLLPYTGCYNTPGIQKALVCARILLTIVQRFQFWHDAKA